MKKFVILLFVFLVYLSTLPSDIDLGDSGTLAAAAVSWGIPHPPGFPSYVLIAHWFSYLPWGTMAQKLAMVSVLASVATVGLVMEMAGIIPALILAFSYGFWSQAVNVETYALTNLVIVLVSWMIGPTSPKATKGLVALGVVLGVGVGLNPIVVGVVPSLVIPAKAGIYKNRSWIPAFAGMACFIVIAMGVYSYLPIRAGQNPFLNWSDPSTVERFIKHVTGGGLSVVSSTAVNGFTGSFYWLANSFGRFIYVFFVETLGVGMILAIIGGYLMFKKERNKFWYWVILVLTNVILAGIYVSGNRDSWYITGMIGAVMMGRMWKMRVIRGMGGILIIAMLVIWGPRMWERARSNYVGTYINDLYKDLPEKAILIGGGETFNSLTLYAHEAIKLRTDVTPVDFSIFYGQGWYRENFKSQKLKVESKKVEEANFTDEGEFSRILEQFVEANSDRPVFITGFLLRRPIYGGSLRPAYVPERYQLVQKGIVYQLIKSQTPNSKIQTNSKLEIQNLKIPYYLESNYLKAVEDIQLDYGLALEMRGDFFGAAAVAPKYFDQNRLNTKIKELNNVK